MSYDFVDDDEILYRRIAADRKCYTIKNDMTIEILSTAFGDRGFKISVDRAKLCGYNPLYTLGDGPGVVAFFKAWQLRNIGDLSRNDARGNPIINFKIKIDPVPLQNNKAHAEIYATPEFTESDKKGAFHRLCRRLARIAEQGQWIDLSTC